MTENEAIKDIKENVQPSVGGISLEMAIQALEKQVPKKPRLYQKGLLDAEMWHCPICEKELISNWNRDFANEYCHNCGQKLDWSEE